MESAKMRAKLTPTFISKAAAEPGAERTVYWDESMPGFGLVVTKTGAKSFVYQYRAGFRSRRMTFPFGLGLEKARKEAKKALGGVASGGDPLQERRKAEATAENTFQSICEEYFRRDGKRLRTKDQIEATLKRLVYAKLGARQIDSILRSEIVRLLDKVEDERGPIMADRVLAHVRKIMAWHATRTDDFRSPIVRGMARTKPKERARDRILSDDELRAVWKAAEGSTGPFGYMLRFILLTMTRRCEASDMPDTELQFIDRMGIPLKVYSDEVIGVDWVIPGARYKTKLDHVIPLSQAARDLLASIPRIEGVPYLFTTGRTPISGFSKFKEAFDEAVLKELRKHNPEVKALPNWTLHDLRRTGRSLMGRAGVDADHAERCMGHVIGGVRGTYDRHAYHAEKKQAFEALAAQIDRILNPQDNVIPLKSLEPQMQANSQV
jgi:integrase